MNEELNPWAYLHLRLSEAEVLEIAKRGCVMGQTASRILEAATEACDEFVRFQQGAMLPRRKSRRPTSQTPRPKAVPGLRRPPRQRVLSVPAVSDPSVLAREEV